MIEYSQKRKSGRFVSGREWTDYKQVTVDDPDAYGSTIKEGDLILFEDPDLSYHDETAAQQLFVGRIEKIRQVDGDDGPRFLTTLPVGHLDLDSHTQVCGEGFDNVEKWDRKFIEQFLSSDNDKWMSWKWPLSGEAPEIDGE